jgi:hypothetical protein
VICEECAWEADQRKFHGPSVKIPVTKGHRACQGGTHCDCHHMATTSDGIPGVIEYAEELQEKADKHKIWRPRK